MLKKISTYLKSHINKLIIHGSSIFTIACMMLSSSVNAFASSQSYTKPLDSLKTVILTVLGSAGAAVLAYGIYSIAMSFRKKDQGGIEDAINTIAMGAIMLGGSFLIGVLTA